MDSSCCQSWSSRSGVIRRVVHSPLRTAGCRPRFSSRRRAAFFALSAVARAPYHRGGGIRKPHLNGDPAEAHRRSRLSRTTAANPARSYDRKHFGDALFYSNARTTRSSICLRERCNRLRRSWSGGPNFTRALPGVGNFADLCRTRSSPSSRTGTTGRCSREASMPTPG